MPPGGERARAIDFFFLSPLSFLLIVVFRDRNHARATAMSKKPSRKEMLDNISTWDTEQVISLLRKVSQGLSPTTSSTRMTRCAVFFFPFLLSLSFPVLPLAERRQTSRRQTRAICRAGGGRRGRKKKNRKIGEEYTPRHERTERSTRRSPTDRKRDESRGEGGKGARRELGARQTRETGLRRRRTRDARACVRVYMYARKR